MALDRTIGVKRGVAFLPNLLTTANLFCGYYSIIQSVNGHYAFAVWLVVLAGLFDFLDGRVARMTGTQSDFGVEYDSLSDLTTFCMAPAILVYNWGLAGFGKFGVAACFMYFACGALRLARFNVQAGDVEKVDFQGLPTPSAAGTMVSYVLFHDYFFGHPLPDSRNYFLIVLPVLLALLMVSNIRYRSMKKIKSRASFFQLVSVVVAFFVIAARPEITLFLVGVIYVSAGIIGRVKELRNRGQSAQTSSSAYSSSERPFPKRFRRRRGRRQQEGYTARPNVEERQSQQQPSAPSDDNVVKIVK
jgi:CDP-diacylglycerol--serine O-phosphatidyltransferase